uniref:WAK_assoc domain-containing protein n=1 Tax=Heterorhabditis bacteriophora TaxID=37862 RepID=A0A1I7WRJ5_HETBA
MDDLLAVEGASQGEEFVLVRSVCNFSSITDHTHDQDSSTRPCIMRLFLLNICNLRCYTPFDSFTGIFSFFQPYLLTYCSVYSSIGFNVLQEQCTDCGGIQCRTLYLCTSSTKLPPNLHWTNVSTGNNDMVGRWRKGRECTGELECVNLKGIAVVEGR